MTDTPTTQPDTPTLDAGRVALDAMVAGLDGVTIDDDTLFGLADMVRSHALEQSTSNRSERLVERLTEFPDTIRAIASYVSALEAAVAEAEKMCDEFDAMNDARHRAVMALEARALAAEGERDRMRAIVLDVTYLDSDGTVKNANQDWVNHAENHPTLRAIHERAALTPPPQEDASE